MYYSSSYNIGNKSLIPIQISYPPFPLIFYIYSFVKKKFNEIE